MAGGAHFRECRICFNNVSNGNDYGRIKLNGKLIRECNARLARRAVYVFSSGSGSSSA
jgi:hypothetical protein